MADSRIKQFTFNNQASQLYPLVTEITGYINQYVSTADTISTNLKIILVELLTNSLKHSGADITILKFELKANQILIHKTDTGNALAIQCGHNLLEWPLPGVHHSNNVITIYNDAYCKLKACLKDNCALHFFVEEFENPTPLDINALAEHFGLMIITQASTMFTYQFDIDTCTNNFLISIEIEK